MTIPLNVFVYGTLKPGACNYAVCEPYVIGAQRAIAHGSLYHLPFGYPALTIEVPGIVQGWRLTMSGTEALSVLDEFEQHDPEVFCQTMPKLALEAHQYQRVLLPVFTPERSPLDQAWAYTMTLAQIDRLNGQPIPTGCWNGLLSY